jgi:hypothetical protein
MPAPTVLQHVLRSMSSTSKPFWCKAAANVSPAIPPPTINVLSTLAICRSNLDCISLEEAHRFLAELQQWLDIVFSFKRMIIVLIGTILLNFWNK